MSVVLTEKKWKNGTDYKRILLLLHYLMKELKQRAEHSLSGIHVLCIVFYMISECKLP